MPSIYSTWNYQNVIEAFTTVIHATVGKDGYEANRQFVECHNHWQHGIVWPVAGGVTPAMRTKILKAVEPQFTPVDVIGEALDNVANGLLEQEASVTFAAREPADPEMDKAGADVQAKEIATMVELLSAWWDRVGFWESAKEATRRSRWSTRGALRLWIPPARLNVLGDGSRVLPRDLAFADALENIRVLSPDPSAGMVYTDTNTQETAGLFTYCTGKAGSEKKSAEIWYVEGDDTIIRVVSEGSSDAETFKVQMGKRMPITQMTAKLLIKDTVRRQQNRLNFFETILVRLGETAGFRERYTTNAMPQGSWLDTPPTDGPALEVREVEGKKWYLHSVPRTLGAAITTDLRGCMTEDANGKQMLATPGVVIAEPTDPDFAIKSCDHARETILRECKQGHLASQSKAELSGNAYDQARAVHEKDLVSTKGPLEGMIREAIEAAIALGEFMTKGGSAVGTGGSFLERYRCVVNLHVDAGPASPEEQAQTLAQYQAGIISEETAMTRLDVEDTAAERTAIDKSAMGIASLRAKQGVAIKALTDAGASLVGAAQVVGLSEEDAKKLVARDTESIGVQP